MLAGGCLLALAGCLPWSDQPPRLPVDPELATRSRIAEEVRALARYYGAVMERFPAVRPELATLAAEHEEHSRALLGPTPTTPSRSPSPSGTPSRSPSPSPSGTPSTPVPAVPESLAAALGSLVDAELAAARRRSRQAGRASPALARLLASVAGCEAAHAALLSSPAGSP